MTGINGVFRKTLEVYCAGCENSILGLPGNRDFARDELRQQYGWAIRKGLWHCPDCKNDPFRIGRCA
jgi:hypothetical protein